MRGIFLLLIFVFSQSTLQSQNQVWVGYMTSTALNKKYSLWNDMHFVPGGFFLIRTGITKTVKPVNITVGYAYGRLPYTTESKSLNRQEHRPWFQLQSSIILGKQLFLIPRFRYDGRFRQDIENNSILGSYSFTNRVRLMATVRKFIVEKETRIGKPFISVGDELLMNFGKHVVFNQFDQNRFFILAGTQYKNVQLQAGYMNRYVNTAPATFTQNHTLIIWVTQQFNWKKRDKSPVIELDGE